MITKAGLTATFESCEVYTVKTYRKVLKSYKSKHCTVLAAAAAKSLQSGSTLFDPIDGSPPGSPVPGILQARTHLITEWETVSKEFMVQ